MDISDFGNDCDFCRSAALPFVEFVVFVGSEPCFPSDGKRLAS